MSFKSPLRLVPTIRNRMDAVLGNLPQTYDQKVLSYGPTAYWPLAETSGTTAVNLVNAAMNGTYKRDVSVMGTQAGIGDGYTAPTFNGAQDFVDIFSAALAAAFNGDTGGACAWARVSGIGVWTDGADRMILRFTEVAGQNEIGIPKHSSDNAFRWRTKRNNVFVGTLSAESTTAWALWSISWDANGFYLYRNGTSRGTPALAQPWSNALTIAMIGASEPVAPTWFWSGGITKVGLFDYTVPQSTWQDLVTV